MTLARIKLPLSIVCGSLVILTLIFLATTPVNNIVYIALFFVVFFIFINSLLYLMVTLQQGVVGRRSKQRIIFTSTSILALMMFMSTRSLSVVDVLILVLIIYGLYFYSGRR